MLVLLEKSFKVLFVLSLLSAIALYWVKDDLPPASFYDLASLSDPLQQPTRRNSFMISAEGETYQINQHHP